MKIVAKVWHSRIIFGVAAGLVIVGGIALLLHFVPHLRRVDVNPSTLTLAAPIWQQIQVPWQAKPASPALAALPSTLNPDNCTAHGTKWTCDIQLSASHIPIGGITWAVSTPDLQISVNPPGGQLLPGKPSVAVTISHLPCSAETLTFTGIVTITGKPVTSASVNWQCSLPTPTPTSKPSPTAKPTPTAVSRPSPTANPTPTASPTPTPIPTPTSQPTVAPTSTPRSTVAVGPGSSPPTAKGGAPTLLSGATLTIASLLIALLSLGLYLMPRSGDQRTLLRKLRAFILPGAP
ncbi:MAG TPA: hypothetical protein VGD98_07680 [Ktedonobacteraceae bacterium]